MIRTKWGKTDVATVKKNTQVRYQGGVKSPVLAELKKKDEVTIIESEENWKKIRTKEGVIGYVKNNTLKNEEKKNKGTSGSGRDDLQEAGKDTVEALKKNFQEIADQFKSIGKK